MLLKRIIWGTICLLGFTFTFGCVSAMPDVQVRHSPIIATSSEKVTFTATVAGTGRAPFTIEMYVNDGLVKSCAGMNANDTCVYEGGPYAAQEMSSVFYKATITDSEMRNQSRGAYSFAITDDNYDWSRPYIPARVVSLHGCKEDLVFHMGTDYGGALDQLIDDAEDKMYAVYLQQHLMGSPPRFDSFNFYVYSHTATVNYLDPDGDGNSYVDACGAVDARADTDMSWRDDDAILHVASAADCTNAGLKFFSAEGSNTKAFLHESGHAVFALADEYDADPDCYTNYRIGASPEPNIFAEEADCRTEQSAKGRNPDGCWEFTTCDGGWWGIHQLADGNVMIQGMVGDPWGIEASERVLWVFDEYARVPCIYFLIATLEIPIAYQDDLWTVGQNGPFILPCDPPSPVLQGAESAPLLILKNEEGKAIYQRHMIMDPRIILTNPPSQAPVFLEEVAFTLRLPVIEGMTVFEFYVEPYKEQEPTIRIELKDVMAEFEAAGGPSQEAVCQDPPYGGEQPKD